MQSQSSISATLIKKKSWFQKQLSNFCWYWKIGWKNPIIWIDSETIGSNGKDINVYYEETWVNAKSREVRKIRGKYRLST